MGTTLISLAKVRGKNHDRCEDHVAYRRRNGWNITVLADGAGSRPRGGEGAHLVAHYLVRVLPSLLRPYPTSLFALRRASWANDVAKRIVSTLKQMLSEVGLLDELSSTLLFCIHHERTTLWLLGHIGDGVIGAIDGAGSLQVVSHPDNGEFANETCFVTDRCAENNLRLYLLFNVRGIVLMSDGTAHTFYARQKRLLAPAISRLFDWQKTEGEKQTNTILRMNIKRHVATRTDDDCSIVLMQTEQKVNRAMKITFLKEQE